MRFKLFATLLVTIFSTCVITFNLSPSTGLVKVENYGYIDKAGKLVIKTQFSEVMSFSQGLAAVKISDKWGYIDEIGKVIVRPQYSEVVSFSQGLAAVKLDDKWGYIDKTGKVVVEPQYSGTEIIDVQNFSQGLAVVLQKDGDGTCGPVLCVYGYIDRTGKMIVEPQFFEAREFSEGLAAVLTNESAGGVVVGEWGYINGQSQLVIKPIFSEANSFSEGLAAVEIGTKNVLYEESGETLRKVIPGKWGYIDGTGKQVISPQFDLANSFSERLAAVKVKDKCGYINKTGKIVVQPHFSSCESFSEGLAGVKIAR